MYIVAILAYILIPIITVFGIRKNRTIWQGFDLKSTQQLKGICALYIVLHHMSFCSTEVPMMLSILLRPLNYIGQFLVAIYFCLSGYGLMSSYNKNKTKPFWNKKIKNIYLPFVVANVVYMIFLRKNIFSLQGFKYILGINLIDSVCWYVIEIIILYFVFWLIFYKTKFTENTKLVVVVLVQIVINNFLFLGRAESFWMKGNLCFSMGIFLFKLIYGKKNIFKTWNNIQVGTLILGMAVGMGLQPKIMLINIVLMLTTSVAIIFLRYFHFESVVILFLGTISYEIYILHMKIANVIDPINIIEYLLYFCCLFVASFFLHKVFLTQKKYIKFLNEY